MKLGNLSKLVAALIIATNLELCSAGKLLAQNAYTIIGLRGNNSLVRFGSTREVQIRGVDGFVQGIDYRPANGLLYGITDTDKIYTINPNTGAATFVSTLSRSFNGGFQSGVDFNPVADRLRIVGSNGQNFRVNVDTGAVIVDNQLFYASGDPNNSGTVPYITAAAYTNSRAGATSTQLFDIDYDLNVLALQNPPNNGILSTIGTLGINFAPIGGFDIFTDTGGMNTAFVISGPTLYTIDLSTGSATRLGTLFGTAFIGLAVTRSQ